MHLKICKNPGINFCNKVFIQISVQEKKKKRKFIIILQVFYPPIWFHFIVVLFVSLPLTTVLFRFVLLLEWILNFISHLGFYFFCFCFCCLTCYIWFILWRQLLFDWFQRNKLFWEQPQFSRQCITGQHNENDCWTNRKKIETKKLQSRIKKMPAQKKKKNERNKLLLP